MTAKAFAGKRLLVLAPHPDDETFGCAGLLARAVAEGGEVAVLVISAPSNLVQYGGDAGGVPGTTRVEEFESAMAVLGVRNHHILFADDAIHMRLDAMDQMDLVRLIERDAPFSLENFRPDTLCIPAVSYNQDHEALWKAAMAACRPHLVEHKAFCSRVLVYEQPQLAWGRPPLTLNTYVDIGEYLDVKLAAYRNYGSQVRPEPHHASIENVERLARIRGAEVSVSAAEAFQCLRWVI